MTEVHDAAPEYGAPDTAVSQPDREGRVTVTAKQGAEIFVDRCSSTSSSSRRKLLSALSTRFPYFRDEQHREELDGQIMRVAAQTPATSRGDAAAGERVNVERIIQALEDEEIEFFYDDDDGETHSFLSFVASGHRENFQLHSSAAKLKVRSVAWRKLRHVVGEQQMNDLLGTLEMKAVHEGEQHKVSIRSVYHDGRVYIDLCNADWEVVEVDGAGWTLRDSTDVPVRFVRPKGMKPLPTPVRGGDLKRLERFVNVPGRNERILCLAWLLAVLRTAKTYAVLVIIGESGSAKSSTCEVLRRLVDPNKGNLRIKPRTIDDLYISAVNSRVLCFENVSVISDEMSDALCAITTGSAQAKRQLYSNNEESFADARRPVMINGINNPVTRPDLSSRTVLVSLPRIEDSDRLTEGKLDEYFDAEYPAIFGALLDLLAGALREEEKLERLALPRMADYCQLGVAMERALGLPEGDFLAAFKANQEGSHWTSISASVIGPPILELMEERGSWTGTAEALRVELSRRTRSEDKQRRSRFPTTPSALSHELRSLAPSLRAIGMSVEYGRAADRKRTRSVTLAWSNGGDTDGPDGADGELQSSEGLATPPLSTAPNPSASAGQSASRPAREESSFSTEGVLDRMAPDPVASGSAPPSNGKPAARPEAIPPQGGEGSDNQEERKSPSAPSRPSAWGQDSDSKETA